MSQPTTNKPVSSQRGPPPDNFQSSPAGVGRRPKLISLSKLKDLMRKNPADEQRRCATLSRSSGSEPTLPTGIQLQSMRSLNGALIGARKYRIAQDIDKLALARPSDRYSLLSRRLSGQQGGGTDIEGGRVEKTDGQRSSFGDHHQSRAIEAASAAAAATAAALNQFGIRVTQQELAGQPQNRTATTPKRYNTNNNATPNKNSEKEVEFGGANSGGFHQDKRAQQLDQASREDRKLARPYSSPQSNLGNARAHRSEETLNSDKSIEPCRIDCRVRINMTPSSEAFCHSLESVERQHSSQLHGSFESYTNINQDESSATATATTTATTTTTTTNCFAAALQSEESRLEDGKDSSRSVNSGDNGGSKVLRLERAEQYLEARSRAAVSKAYADELAAAATISRSLSPSSGLCSSLPTEDATSQVESFASNSSVIQGKYKPVNESTSTKQNFFRAQSSAAQVLAQQQSRQAKTECAGRNSELEANLRSKTSYFNTAGSDSISNQADCSHLAPYIGNAFNRFANESHPESFADQMVAASHHHSKMMGHNVNSSLAGARLPNYIIDRSNIRVSVSATVENTGSLPANCDISQQQQQQQQHATSVAPSNECIPDHNYNSYNSYNLMTSSKSSSPNSVSLTPSPKAQAMQALAASHQSASQMAQVGLQQQQQQQQQTQIAMNESLLDHSSHHYISGAANVASNLQHQQVQNQQHYAYSQQTPPTIPSNHHHQPHHQQITATNHEHPAYSHLQHQAQPAQQQQPQHQHQQQQQQQQQLQHPQHHQQHPYQQHQQQHAQHQSISNNPIFNYHQIANGTAVGSNHGYTNVANNVHYHSQMQSSNNQTNSLISEAHQSHLNTAAAAAHAAAAVVSQTLKTVANQHNQHQHYGHQIANGFGSSASLMNMAGSHHPQFHNVAGLAQHHHHAHHLGHNHAAISIQASQQQSHQPQARSLPVHQATHSVVTRKYQCRMCPQVFMSKAEMKYHNQNHLREAKPYKCLQCPKAFANSSYLSQHMRIHQGLKPYACDICSRKFTQLSHLQQHKRTHTGDKPYKCNYMNCTKQFSQLSNLQSHSRCHQLDKPYKCNSCYKCFHDEQSLLEHIPRHLESKHLKRNLCIFCGSSYQQERGLVKHFQQYHTDKSPTLVTAAIAAGTTGNTSLIASLVSSSQGKFVTPSTGSSTTSSISSNSSNISTISNHCQMGEHVGGAPSGNTNTAHSNLTGSYQVGGYH